MTLCEYLNTQFSLAQNLDFFVRILVACLCGACPEGKMCCGKTAEVRAKYAAIKEGAAV